MGPPHVGGPCAILVSVMFSLRHKKIMDISQLHLLGTGYGLTAEEESALQIQLLKRKAQEKLYRHVLPKMAHAWAPQWLVRRVTARRWRAPRCAQRSCRPNVLALRSIQFWGRIVGTTADYLIAVGLADVMEEPRKQFYFW